MRRLLTLLALLVALLPGSLKAARPLYGISSWYGQERQGKLTASGEVFDKNLHTAAHMTLPLGTLVRVTNLKTQAVILLRVNDRGPGIAGREIDVSWSAAKELGFLEAGLTRVKIEVVGFYKIKISCRGSR